MGTGFDIEHPRKTYFRQALPVVLNMVVTLVYNMADTYFVARTGNALLVAGVSLCSPIFTMLMAFGNIFGQGGSSLISRMVGQQDTEGVKRVSSFCFYIALLVGAVLAVPMMIFQTGILHMLGASKDTILYAGQYYRVLAVSAPLVLVSFIHSNLLRCEGMATESMLCTVSGSILNIILDPIFISVLGWGATGAAAATILGYVLGDILCLMVVLRKTRYLSVTSGIFRVRGGELSQILSVGITAAITNIATSICTIVMNQYLVTYGDEKIAALGIVLRIVMIAQLVLVGFSFGGVALFGYLYGAGEHEKLGRLFRFLMVFLSSLALVLTVILFVFASGMMRIFIQDPGIVADGTQMLRWQVPGSVFAGIVLLCTCCFQATGHALPALVLSLSRQGILFIIVMSILTMVAGYQGFLMSQLTADVLSAVLALLLYRRYSVPGSGTIKIL